MEPLPITLLVRNAQVFNSYRKAFHLADVAIVGEKIFYIDRAQTWECNPERVLDAQGKYMIPGFIDIHMHIESSMLTPGVFATRLAQCGVTTVVTEPHEMANVAGLQGVLDMIDAGSESPVDLYYGIPSCVPASNATLEGTGGIITCEDMKALLKNPAVVCVGEVMNYRQIIQENQLEIAKFLTYLKATDPKFPVEGHCPSLLDTDLAKFLFLGIDADHTEHTLEELIQRIDNGMFMEIQNKMMTPEVMDYLMDNHLYEHFCFVTDDVMADVFHQQGHLNVLVAKAIAMGMRPEDAIYNATYTPARRMQFFDRGTLAPGKLADFILLDDLDAISIAQVYKKGQRVDCCTPTMAQHFPAPYYQSVHLTPLTPAQFQIKVDKPDGIYTVRVMEVQPHVTHTKEVLVDLPVVNGVLQWEGSGLCLCAVCNRYGTGDIGYGLATGTCLHQGAVATTYAHDHHNLLVLGANVQDLLVAANQVIALQGGMVVANQGQVVAQLPLPVGGILTDQSVEMAGTALAEIRSALVAQGYEHNNPIMSLGTLSLAVSPALKLTDKGLVNVKEASLVSLLVSNENNTYEGDTI